MSHHSGSESSQECLAKSVAEGGHFGHAVLGTQIVNRNTIVHQHAVNVDSPALPPGHFRLSAHITVSENDPINRDSRIYRAKLHSKNFGDLEIAVKILSDGERQRREVQIHFKIPHHKNIVERILTDTFKYQGQSCIYIAMEQCDPENLYAHVVSLAENNAPYDAKMFMSFAFQIATGLEFLHRHKILNRDLKPENILLSSDKKIAKIADFGMSKEMTSEASTVSTLQPGTDGWRSPEILKNVQRITMASDMFSLGLIFHFLWSYGKHAFGDDPHAWNLYIKRGINMTLDGLKIPNSKDAKYLLRSLLSQNPPDRPSALEVLRGDVFEEPRQQSDLAAIYSGTAVARARGSAAIDNKGTDKSTHTRVSFLGKFRKNFHRKSAIGTKENISMNPAKSRDGKSEGTKENLSMLHLPTENPAKDQSGKSDSPPLVDVNVAGGHFGHAVLGTQVVNRNTIVHQHAVNVDAPTLPPGHFRLSAHITVSENDPINRDSRIYRAKLHSEIFGDLEIATKILSDGERQRREAQIHFKIPHHKNIVERILTDTFKYRGQSCIYIAMEQCDPDNLYAHVVSLAENNAPYDAKMFMSFAFQIATGLEFLHRHKILNRNLKPENILLSADKKIAKIADFGMSKEMTGEASTVCALQPGTDGWRSPEILQNVERITLASDMFSLGLIFHFLWSYGKHAFGDDHHAWNLYIKRGMNMTLDGLKISNSNDAKRLLRSLLNQNPTERPSALEVLRDIVFEEPLLQSDSAAIYSGITAKGTEKNVATSEDKEKNVATLSSPTPKTSTNMVDVRRNLLRYGIKIRRFTRDFWFGKEWEGRFNGQKVTIAQFNEDDWEKYKNAVGVLTNVEHENIVHLIKDVPELRVIVTESGEETLAKYLRGNGKQAELSNLLRMAGQIASGMDFLYGKKCIHRDLRAGNVAVTANSLCKISGFILIRHVGPIGSIVLQQGAMSPIRWAAQEVIKYGLLTFKSDVWSFGVLLWEIMTRGQEPYKGMLNREAVESICSGHRMLRPRQCPSRLYFDTMRPCWDENPDSRPTFECLEKSLLSYDAETEEKEESMTVRALRDFTAAKRDELSFMKGDIIGYCAETHADGAWCQGNFDGYSGSFPSKHVIQIKSEESTNIQDLRKNLQGYDVDVQRLAHYFRFGKEWEGQFNHQKVIIAQYFEDGWEKYENAVGVLTELEHENIVHFIKEVPELCVIVTEFCEETLEKYLRGSGKQAELNDLLRMAAQVASGMDFLHRKKYVHSDLRAKNVAVTGNSLCKISTRHVGSIGSIVLRPGRIDFDIRWTAQEVHEGLTFKSDVWSFGVLLWEIVTRGQTPYPGMSNADVRKSICSGYRMFKPQQCPSGLYFDIMRSCWDENPDARPTFQCLEKSLLSYDIEAEEKEESMTVRALRDFTSAKVDELRFKKGDIIAECTEYDSGARLKGTFDDQSGSFPSKYVIQIKSEESTNIVDVRRNLHGYGVGVQRFTRDLPFRKEWEGRFSDQKVIIMQFSDAEKYENSVDVLTNLEHENIVHFIKQIPELCVLATEFYDGTLEEYLRGHGKLADLTDLLRMAAQVASGMDFVRRKNYIHCDLRSESVAVTANLRCKISGFNLTRYVGSIGSFKRQPGETVFPWKWTAQEVIEHHQVTFKSDVWSFGVLLCEIVTRGRIPYPGMSNADVRESICSGHRMLKPKQCPSRLYFDIMRPCWDKNPDARPTFQCLEESLLSYDTGAEEEEESMTVHALHDFTAAKEDELSFKKGDIIVECTEYDDGARLKGTFDGQSGSFPSKHLIQIKSKESTNIVDVRRNLQGYGVDIQKFQRDFWFGKEWEGRFCESRVTITQYAEGDVEKYKSAVNAMRNFEHENIVRFLKEVPEFCVVITEFCKVTLQEYLRGDGKQAELSDLLRMAAQIASGMDFLHQKKYVHCDLRARNIVVAGSSLCKISGFGMILHVGLRDFAELQVKTKLPIKWAAPEALECRQITFKSDVWSFGVLLWEIVTRGQTPYPGIAKADVAKSIRGGHRMLKPEHCPEGLYFDIMRACWDENPDARPTFECLEKTLLSYDLAAEEKEESVTVRALYGNAGVLEEDLIFKKGDIIVDCTNYDGGAWWQGTLDSRKGLFPSNYVIQIKNKDA